MTRRKVVLYKAFIVAFTYVLFELCCFIAIQTRYVPARLPSFHFVLNNPTYPIVWADINPVWGNWHYPETFRLQSGCLNFQYQINAVGARDKERTKQSHLKNRIIALGDSFIEGFGIEASFRLSNMLEQKTGREVLNFGCSDFGTTQEFLIYDHLAKQFDHSTVMIGFLPLNDFENDDTAFKVSDKYRPYFISTDSGYHLAYYTDQLSKSVMNKDSFKVESRKVSTIISRFLRAYTFWFNIIDFVRFKDMAKPVEAIRDNKVVSYYYDYNPQQIQKLEFVLSKLRAAAINKRIILFTIPVLSDYLRYDQANPPPLPKEMNRICQRLQIEYLDLMPPMLQEEKEYRKLFLSCDPHWNEYANQLAASILIEHFKLK